ncbi:MAG: LysR substrate-binding domain-containing protein [Gammaproteobacteria bacterium]|nr:LysR substrate-binding domain-containing protein [Gammaproteobacteria bacterium]
MRYLLTLRFIDAVARVGSIRKAAETLAITSTALNRRILAIEEELGVEIFERLPTGVRLSAAGEIFLHHIRQQISDLERVKSQIDDLAGERRGHVAIACSQALLTDFLPKQIAIYRSAHPAVTFSVYLRDRVAAEKALAEMSADLALVFEPVERSEFQVLHSIQQPVCVVMKQSHPLADQSVIRVRDCLAFPLALPSAAYGVRHLLDMAARRRLLKFQPAIESDNFEFLRSAVAAEDALTFQIPIGLPANLEALGLIMRPLAEQDVPPGVLEVGQLRGRILPVAASRFAEQVLRALVLRFE